jgi:hypothetical protein
VDTKELMFVTAGHMLSERRWQRNGPLECTLRGTMYDYARHTRGRQILGPIWESREASGTNWDVGVGMAFLVPCGYCILYSWSI